MDNNHVSHFLSLSDQVLTEVIFPNLSLDIIENLCFANNRFKNICNNEVLWKTKVYDEFSQYVSFKPSISTWKDFYYLLIRGPKLPLYYNGDIIEYTPFRPNLINMTLSIIVNYINSHGLSSYYINIAFIDSRLDLIVNITYPYMRFNVKDFRYHMIEKIILILDDNFDKDPLIGARNKPLSPASIIRTNNINKLLIYNELTSIHGTPPLYVITDDEDNIRILDNSIVPGPDQRRMNMGKNCQTFKITELYDMLKLLNVQPPNINQSEINLYLDNNRVFDIGLRTNMEYNTRWILAQYPRKDLCNIIIQTLEQIGHIVYHSDLNF